MPRIAHIAIALPLPTLFDYLYPADMALEPGMRVEVPFGKKTRTGLVVHCGADEGADARQLKHVLRPLDDWPLLTPELMQTLAWASRYWLGAPGEVFMNAMPLWLRQGKALPSTHFETWQITAQGRIALEQGKRRGKSRQLLQLLQHEPRAATTLAAELPGWRDAARRLQRADLLSCHFVETRQVAPPVQSPVLNTEQAQAVAAIRANLDAYHAYLLEGVTGSGKTEVYIAIIRDMLARERQTLMLVPEISLTPQTIRRLQQQLGVDIEVLHSNLAAGDRARAWLRARKGSAKVIVGTRSAIFTPLAQPGLIVVDEEHGGSYKQQDGFRYHARDLALVRAHAMGIPIILGSATPSLESLHNVARERMQALRLRQRAQAPVAPRITVLDVRGQRMAHGLSNQLLHGIRDAVARNEQVLVFRNRRGYAPVLMCHQCGWYGMCQRCERALTLHAGQQRLICHHCGHTQKPPVQCPQCEHTPLKPHGFGTERLDEALRQRFADTPIWRVDSETMQKRDAFHDMFAQLKHDQAAILIGTQILAKGHDLPNLTLVAITGVDEGLLSIDFRAQEYLAQLITQVAGRAGRADKPGQVMLQTHYPQHPFLQLLLHQGYHTTAMHLLEERRQLRLPPYSHQILLSAEAVKNEPLMRFLRAARQQLPAHEQLQVYGPMPAPMPKRAGKQRAQLLLEASQRSILQPLAQAWHKRLFQLPEARKVRWAINVDPLNLYG